MIYPYQFDEHVWDWRRHNDQFDLFDYYEAYARSTDPQTSHDAANSLDEETLSHMESIALEAAWSCGLRGMINDDLVRITGLPWKSITPRMAPLERKGFVWKRIDPETGKPMTRRGASGRSQEIYFATGPKGEGNDDRKPSAEMAARESRA